MKAENPIELRVEVDSSPRALNTEQRKLYNTIVDHYDHEISPGGHPPQPQLLLNVDGVAGTRKTFTPSESMRNYTATVSWRDCVQ